MGLPGMPIARPRKGDASTSALLHRSYKMFFSGSSEISRKDAGSGCAVA